MNLLKYIIVLILIPSISSCARRGNPSGGPKDEDAPITIKTIPEFKTVNFDKNEILIYFDEYIKLKDINKNLIISPPFKHPAEITPLGVPSKKMTIIIKDTLLENTTYTLNFGESIVDNNEGNVLKGFKYIFSTGTYIDSLSINGTVKDALSKEKKEYVAILLYKANKSYTDSTIFKEQPLYVTNSLDSIGWEINNLRKGKYHIFAIKEENNDLIFNPKTDKIAFYDSVISIPSEKEFNLKLFKEIPEFKPFKPLELAKGHIVFGFEGKSKDFKVEVDLKKSGIDSINYMSFLEREKDTLNYYFTNDKKLDSLVFKLTNTNFLSEEVVKLRNKAVDSLLINSSIRGTLHFRDTMKLTTNNPLNKFTKNLFSIYNKDTIKVDFSLKQNGYKELLVLFDKKEEQRYKIEVLPNAITDFFNQVNKDTLNYNLRTVTKDKYGSISLKVNNVKDRNIIVQLLNLKEVLIDEKYTNKDSQVEFELLSPTKYLVRLIIDSNKNNKWDTGNFLKKIQPEKVIHFNKEIDVKENWFVNESIEVK